MATLAELAAWLKPRGAQARLPTLIVMTDTLRLADPVPIIAALPRNSAVILRHYQEPTRVTLAGRLADLCRRRRIRLLIAGDGRLAAAIGADGVHLPEVMISHAAARWRLWRRPGWVVTAAVHSPAAAMRAFRAGADAVLLSPVFATPSHPQASPLGPLLFARWARQCPLPVYALGGVSQDNIRRLHHSGAVGIAGIGIFQTD